MECVLHYNFVMSGIVHVQYMYVPARKLYMCCVCTYINNHNIMIHVFCTVLNT